MSKVLNSVLIPPSSFHIAIGEKEKMKKKGFLFFFLLLVCSANELAHVATDKRGLEQIQLMLNACLLLLLLLLLLDSVYECSRHARTVQTSEEFGVKKKRRVEWKLISSPGSGLHTLLYTPA